MDAEEVEKTAEEVVNYAVQVGGKGGAVQETTAPDTCASSCTWAD